MRRRLICTFAVCIWQNRFSHDMAHISAICCLLFYRNRKNSWQMVYDSGQWWFSERRHSFPSDAEETAASPGDSTTEQAAMCLCRRLRRGLPSFTGKGFTTIIEIPHYAPNFEKVDRAYGFRVVRASVRSRTVHARVLKLYIDSSWKNIWRTCFFLSELSPFLVLCSFEKIQTALMHAISYEPCMLGFWNFIFGSLMEK